VRVMAKVEHELFARAVWGANTQTSPRPGPVEAAGDAALNRRCATAPGAYGRFGLPASARVPPAGRLPVPGAGPYVSPVDATACSSTSRIVAVIRGTL
jgi:hypothetical protein